MLRLLLFSSLILAGCRYDEKTQNEGGAQVNENQPDLFKISDSIFERYWKLGYEHLTQPQKVFLCIWGLEAEVNNGGFDQFYFNGQGNHAVDIVTSLQAIGAMHTAGLVKATNDLFGPSGPSVDRYKRQEQLFGLSVEATKKMAASDEEFYKYKDNLEELLEAYVIKHSESFSPQ
jgi:hypothetical protein